MTTGTKIFLAVFASFIGVLVLYYGVLIPEAQAPPAVTTATHPTPTSPAAPLARSSPESIFPQNSLAQRSNDADHSSNAGVLTDLIPGAGENKNSARTPPVVASVPPGDNLPLASNVAVNEPLKSAGDSGAESQPVANQPMTLTGKNEVVPQSRTTPLVARSNPPSAPPATSEYTIKSGDTMSSIAESWFGDSAKWNLIARENPTVDPNRLKVGQKIRLPSKDATKNPIPSTAKEQGKDQKSQSAKTDQPLYTVRSGDTLSKIAREYYGDVAKWKTIYDANRTAIGSDPADLKPGMKLKLPPPSKPAS